MANKSFSNSGQKDLLNNTLIVGNEFVPSTPNEYILREQLSKSTLTVNQNLMSPGKRKQVGSNLTLINNAVSNIVKTQYGPSERFFTASNQLQ